MRARREAVATGWRSGPRWIRASVGALCLLALIVMGVHGTQGVRLDLGAIAIDEPLQPGASFVLPTLGVANPGDEPGVFRMRTAALGESPGTPLPDGWVEFEPSTFSLAPLGHQVVRMQLRVPIDAAPGSYSGILVAAVDPPAGGATGLVGAAAGTRLTFTVDSVTGLDALLAPIGPLFGGALPWIGLVVGLAALAIIGWALRRRYDVRIERRRQERRQ